MLRICGVVQSDDLGFHSFFLLDNISVIVE